MDEGSKRNASSTNFGFLFQINVAIYFMFSYLKEISCIRVEGKKEDIELSLINGKKYMIQAKSITKDLYDGHNNISKLSAALVSLDESNSAAIENLFYVSNMLNPLNSSTNEYSQKYDVCIYKYKELSPESRGIIDNQIKAKKLDVFDKDKLVIMRIPFFGDFPDQLYKYIYEEAKTVLTLMSDTLGNKYKSLVEECVKNFLDNSSNPDLSVVVSKKEFCNWIILTELETMDLSNDQLNIGINELDYYEAYQKYQKFISDRIDNYENYSKVYSLYYKASANKLLTISDFVKEENIQLYNYFFDDEIDSTDGITESIKFDIYVAQIISYALLKKKSIIDRIKKEANL